MDIFGENKQNSVTYADNDMQTHMVFIWICVVVVPKSNFHIGITHHKFARIIEENHFQVFRLR